MLNFYCGQYWKFGRPTGSSYHELRIRPIILEVALMLCCHFSVVQLISLQKFLIYCVSFRVNESDSSGNQSSLSPFLVNIHIYEIRNHKKKSSYVFICLFVWFFFFSRGTKSSSEQRLTFETNSRVETNVRVAEWSRTKSTV